MDWFSENHVHNIKFMREKKKTKEFIINTDLFIVK